MPWLGREEARHPDGWGRSSDQEGVEVQSMEFGIIGLGRMGRSPARQAIEKGYRVVALNRTQRVTDELPRAGVDPATSIEQVVSELNTPRIIFIYLTHGEPTKRACQALRPMLAADDIVDGGGNSYWSDSQRRHAFFAEAAVCFLDIGTSLSSGAGEATS
jgi:6-phosphogluconate dehydrogenase